MITLQFCAFASLAGQLVTWFSHGPVGHVDAVLADGSLLGAQARNGLGGQPAGVQIRPADYGVDMEHRRCVHLPASARQMGMFWAFLKAQIGKPYDFGAIAAFACGRNWRTDDAWFCSELIAAALEACGVFSHPLAAPANKITPADLLLLCSAFAPVETCPDGRDGCSPLVSHQA